MSGGRAWSHQRPHGPSLSLPGHIALCAAKPPLADNSMTELFPFAGRSARAPAKGCWGEHRGTPFMPRPYLALIELIGFPWQQLPGLGKARPSQACSCRGPRAGHGTEGR